MENQMPKCKLYQMPQESLLRILFYLNTITIHQLSLASVSIYEWIRSTPSLWRHLHLENEPHVDDAVVAGLLNHLDKRGLLGEVLCVDISRTLVTHVAVLDVLDRCSVLQHLWARKLLDAFKFNFSKFDNALLARLFDRSRYRLTSLRTLALYDRQFFTQQLCMRYYFACIAINLEALTDVKFDIDGKALPQNHLVHLDQVACPSCKFGVGLNIEVRCQVCGCVKRAFCESCMASCRDCHARACKTCVIPGDDGWKKIACKSMPVSPHTFYLCDGCRAEKRRSPFCPCAEEICGLCSSLRNICFLHDDDDEDLPRLCSNTHSANVPRDTKMQVAGEPEEACQHDPLSDLQHVK